MYCLTLYFATDGSDYTGGRYNVTFVEGSSQGELRIPIIDNDQFESEEEFTATLTIPESAAEIGVEAGEDDEATVTINDNDEQIVIDFDPVSYTVNEDDEFAILTVKASAPSSTPYTVVVNTQDGSAVGECHCMLANKWSASLNTFECFDRW